MNSKIQGALFVGALAALALAGCSSNGGAGGYGAIPSSRSSSTSPSAAMPGPASGEMSTASTSLGTIVVDGSGMTLYVFDKDAAHSGTSTCVGNCAATWPAVTTTSTPTATGVTGKLGTIPRPDGTTQVTLDGLPLYRYAADSAAGDVNGQGVGGIWWVVGANGVKITTAPAAGGY